MNALCIQLDIVWSDPPANRRAIAELLASADLQRGDLVVLPEMFSTGFSMDAATLAEPPDGPTATFLSESAGKFGVYLLGGLARRYGETFRNEAVLLAPDGSLIGRYWKMHPFSPSSEADHYTPGDEAVVIPVGKFQLAPAICYDLRFPELFRSAAGGGADLIAVIANWPAQRSDHWACLLRARAIENQAYVVGVNRCGTDPNHTYAGGSVIIDPQGNVLARAGDDQCVIGAPLDSDALNRWRDQFPALRDIRRDVT
ncbi:MAG: carbon-nitrogen family hydrolase [Phycisphaerae bacterium]|jgi:predicted amidohydrolase|nr:carbon-nitrogen family hydrolase [Phycisphaerae bacterium]